MVLHLKDGKIRIDAPKAVPLKGTNSNFEGDFVLFLTKAKPKVASFDDGPPTDNNIYMFNADGTINKRTINVKAALESEINQFVQDLLENMDKELKTDW